MKFICTQENFYKGLLRVVNVANKSTALPILNNVLIKVENSGIILSTTNLEIGIKTMVRGKVEKEGEFTIQAKLLFDFIGFLPKENIEVELIEQSLHITCQNYKTNIKGLPSTDFPVIPEIIKNKQINIKVKDLKQALSQVMFTVTQDESRPEISGVLMNFSNKILTLAGTDSYRLAEKKLKIESEIGEETKIIVPLKTLQEVFRILTDEAEKDISVYINNNQILFQLNSEVELVSRLIEGNYPDYQQIIPTSHKTQAKFSVVEMIKVVKSTALFCKPGINDIKTIIEADKKEIIVTATNSAVGDNIAKFESEINGEKNEVVFNYRYLLDGLNNLAVKEAIIELTNESSPGLIKPVGDDSYLYIIMPIRQ